MTACWRVERVRVELQAQEATHHRGAAVGLERVTVTLRRAVRLPRLIWRLLVRQWVAQRVEALWRLPCGASTVLVQVLLLGQARERHAFAAAPRRSACWASLRLRVLVGRRSRTPERVDALEQALLPRTSWSMPASWRALAVKAIVAVAACCPR